MQKNAIVLDLESQKTFDEVGGQHNRSQLGVSFVGVYSYAQDKYYGFWEKDLPVLENILIREKPLLIGFNTISFDNQVLQPYFKKLQINSLPQLDILAEIEKVLRFRIKLESVAQATLGMGKSGSGLDAIRYYRAKQFNELAKYCLDDVKVTRYVYEYGIQHGQLWYPNAGNLIPMNIPWGEAPSIKEILTEAYEKHLRLQMKYYALDENNVRTVTTREIDLLTPPGDKFKAYCHSVNKPLEFAQKQILELTLTSTNFAHQKALL